MSKYSLNINNNSNHVGDICIYTTASDSHLSDNLTSLAWFNKRAHKGTSVAFSWELDYSFVWSETGKLTPGVSFIASQMIRADPSQHNRYNPNVAYFDKMEGAYCFAFDTHGKTTEKGRLGIYTGSSVAEAGASIGIAIGGKAALVVDATPNFSFTFLPNVKYWVAFGNFEEGVVLDLNSMTNVYEIAFPINEFSKTLTLAPDNTWSEVD